ncbi:MAG: metallophosphatase family protein [Planctomycetota bacterium]|jgi:predicted phosphodiesterase|nr:metallophosphatase family protein [Planctomycetota bacterium]
MRTAIISDVHGNLLALETVLADIRRVGAERIICLGDTVGYGPQPLECLQLVRDYCAVVLTGNHEYAVLHGATDFTPLAEDALTWTTHRLRAPEVLAYLRQMPTHCLEGDQLFVHGSIYDYTNDYVREADSPYLLEQLVNTLRDDFNGFKWVFVGHNHRTFLGTTLGFLFPHDDTEPPMTTFYLAGQKVYVSVGSVGQPRDGDPRASWVLWEDDNVTYYRLEYDWQKTARMILDVGLPKFLARRLQYGN